MRQVGLDLERDSQLKEEDLIKSARRAIVRWATEEAKKAFRDFLDVKQLKLSLDEILTREGFEGGIGCLDLEIEHSVTDEFLSLKFP